jgi:hypothetical protein
MLVGLPNFPKTKKEKGWIFTDFVWFILVPVSVVQLFQLLSIHHCSRLLVVQLNKHSLEKNVFYTINFKIK